MSSTSRGAATTNNFPSSSLFFLFPLFLSSSFLLSFSSSASSLSLLSSPLSSPPEIIAHRGACGYLPEHSLPAYELAIKFGSQYIEPDLVLTKDGVLVALHDVLLDDTTNIRDLPEFKERERERLVEGVKMNGFFACDFTFEELRRSVRVKQRLDGRSSLYDGLFPIPSLEEVLALARKHNEAKEKGEREAEGERAGEKKKERVGVYIELKHPEFHVKDLGFNLSEIFFDTLRRANITVNKREEEEKKKHEKREEEKEALIPIVIQCFDSAFLSQDLSLSTDLPLVQLIEEPERYTEKELEKIASYAQGVGPYKLSLLSNVNGSMERARERVQWAQRRGLVVHPWTFRADRGVLSPFKENFEEEETFFFCCLGVDGLFTEFPDKTRAIVDNIQKRGLCQEFDCSAYKLD